MTQTQINPEILNYFKVERNFIIHNLKLEFEFKSVDIKTLMTDFVNWMNHESVTIQSVQGKKNLLVYIENFYRDNNDRYDTDSVACQNFNNDLLANRKKQVLG
jgi:chitinase